MKLDPTAMDMDQKATAASQAAAGTPAYNVGISVICRSNTLPTQ